MSETGSVPTRKPRRELEELIENQKDQLAKYETRLRDVVRAYKGLVKEKDALDAVIKSGTNPSKSDTTGDTEESNLAKALKTITDEKARLESMFTEDKKKCLSKIKALEGAKTSLEADRSAIKASLEEMKAKWMVERHQRE